MKDDIILNFLRDQKENYISGEDISGRLKVTRSAVWKSIQHLRKLGYEIEAQPHLGYKLSSVPDKMFADELSHGLQTKIIGKRIFSYDSLDSTNDAALKLGEEGLPEGACVFAEHQKKGRGRLGREWVSPKSKNLIVSVLLRPALLPSEVSKMTLVAGVSAVRSIRKFTGQTPGIKWPNDIVYKDKKIGGILTELSAESDRVKFVVVGIGMNINSEARELPPGALSLAKIAGHKIARVEFAKEFLRIFDKDYQSFKTGDFAGLSKQWEEYSATSGRRVAASLFGRKIQGTAVGIDGDGALWIRRDDGLQERVLAGDIEHLTQDSK